jgi:hypothetical protein
MTKILISILVLVALLLPPVGAEGVPNLVGNWTGVGSAAIYEIRDILPGDPTNLTYVEESISKFTMIITEQMGRRFVGTKFPNVHPEESEALLGVIGPDNETLYMVDENGLLDGRLISTNEMEVVYRQVGPTGMIVAINKFTRV